MKVVMKPLSGTAEANLDRAKNELIRVLSFRGDVTSVKAEGSKIVLKLSVNPKWELSVEERVNYLKEWIPAKVKSVFRVLSVSEENHDRAIVDKSKKTAV
jgi:hypothetical protein